MTEPRRARGPRRRDLPAVAAVSAVAFAVVLALLAVQMRFGRDPVLGARAIAPAPLPPRRVLVRRVIVKRVVVEVVRDEPSAAAPAPTTLVASRRTVMPMAPPPTAAPPPAPAPLVTKTS